MIIISPFIVITTFVTQNVEHNVFQENLQYIVAELIKNVVSLSSDKNGVASS